MKIEKTLILAGIFLVIFCITVQAVPILPLVVRGNIEIDDQEADIGTEITAKIDNIEKGSAIVKDKGSYIILVSGEEEDQEKTVEFYINELKTEQTAIFKSSAVIDLNLSADTEPSEKITGAAVLDIKNPAFIITSAAVIIAILFIIFIIKKGRKK